MCRSPPVFPLSRPYGHHRAMKLQPGACPNTSVPPRRRPVPLPFSCPNHPPRHRFDPAPLPSPPMPSCPPTRQQQAVLAAGARPYRIRGAPAPTPFSPPTRQRMCP